MRSGVTGVESDRLDQLAAAAVAEHPGTFLLSLEDAFELGRRVNALNFPPELGSIR